MNDRTNRGVMNVGGTNTFTNSALGEHATAHIGAGKPVDQQSARTDDTWHFGVVTILAEETRAVLEVLALSDDGAAGQRFYTGRLEVPGGTTNLVATQPSGQGQRPIMAALTNLRDRYDPAVVALVGIGGAIHRQVAVNDVVIATRVVFYENRKLLPGRTLRRGQELQAPSAVTHSVNAFFTAAGDPATLPGHDMVAPFRVHNGVIGSGEAVVANTVDDIRRYLTSYNDKTMVVEMEAGGLSQFCQDTTTRSGAPLNWVVIRGISDRADIAKGDQHHNSAAINAAQTLRDLIPHIRPRL
jgi:adenosylhomocysteine nucleosidase